MKYTTAIFWGFEITNFTYFKQHWNPVKRKVQNYKYDRRLAKKPNISLGSECDQDFTQLSFSGYKLWP